MNKMILIGGGGHCKSIIDSVDRTEFEIIGVLDKKENVGKNILDVKVIGDDTLAETLIREEHVTYAFISVGSIGDVSIRKKLYEYIVGLGYHIPNIIDPSAIVSKNVLLGEGTYIGKGAIVNAYSVIGNMCIINTGVVVEHDCNIQDYVHLAPASALCGGVTVGEKTHIGANSVILQNIKIGTQVMIGAGSVVTHDVTDHVTGFGCPFKIK